MSKKHNKAFAFTLAEVLIALGIIGVVSALTVPTLANKYNKKTQAVAAHKVYSQVSDALGAFLTENRADNLKEAGFNDENFYQKYFKIVTDCGNDVEPCFAPHYGTISGATDNSNNVANWCNHSFTIASGESFCICDGLYGAATYEYPTGKKHYQSFFYFDTNGPKPPNIAGRDLFLAYIHEDGSLDIHEATPQCKKYGTTAACFGYASAEAARAAQGNVNLAWPGGWLGKLISNDWEMNY